MKVCWKAVYAPGLASWHAFIKEVGCLLCVCMGRKKFKPQKLCGKLMWESDPTNVLSDLKYVRLTVYRELCAWQWQNRMSTWGCHCSWAMGSRDRKASLSRDSPRNCRPALLGDPWDWSHKLPGTSVGFSSWLSSSTKEVPGCLLLSATTLSPPQVYVCKTSSTRPHFHVPYRAMSNTGIVLGDFHPVEAGGLVTGSLALPLRPFQGFSSADTVSKGNVSVSSYVTVHNLTRMVRVWHLFCSVS